LFLAVNVLCAALKKYPWKRHQTGFLITHAGLLVLVFGGLLTTLGGVEGEMRMIDTDNREIQQGLRMSNTSDTLQLVGRHKVAVFRVPKDQVKEEKFRGDLTEVTGGGVELSKPLKERLGDNYWAVSLRPGSFAWHADEHFRADLPWGLRLLSALAD